MFSFIIFLISAYYLLVYYDLMSSICIYYFSIPFWVFCLKLPYIRKIPKWQVLVYFYLNNFLRFAKVHQNVSCPKFLLYISIVIPDHFISFLFIIEGSISATHPNLIPIIIEFRNSFLGTLTLCAYCMVYSNCPMSTFRLYRFY